MDNESSKELRKLLNVTAKTKGKFGSTLLEKWERFYNSNLAPLARQTFWTCPDGKKIRLKPLLIIESNDVNYKYANLEKVPVLADNFIIFIASKPSDAQNIPGAIAKDIVNRINSIPKLTKENMAFIIRLPDEISKEDKEKWDKEINNLQALLGKNSILVDPSKDAIGKMFQNIGKDIVAFEITHTDKGILLKNGERYISKDIKQGGDLSHIKYLIGGLGTCNLARLEDGNFAGSLREKGVGIIHAPYSEVSSDIALRKFKELINILRTIEKYDISPYYLLDIINQRLGISGEGTINLGKKENREIILGGNIQLKTGNCEDS